MADKTKPTAKSTLFVLFCLVTMVGSCVALLTPSAEREAERQAEIDNDPTSGATYACREFIKPNLIAPASAEFGAWSRWPATLLDSGAVEVIATFDAQNAYGAMIRQVMTCEVAERDGNWYLESLTEG